MLCSGWTHGQVVSCVSDLQLLGWKTSSATWTTNTSQDRAPTCNCGNTASKELSMTKVCPLDLKCFDATTFRLMSDINTVCYCPHYNVCSGTTAALCLSVCKLYTKYMLSILMLVTYICWDEVCLHELTCMYNIVLTCSILLLIWNNIFKCDRKHCELLRFCHLNWATSNSIDCKKFDSSVISRV